MPQLYRSFFSVDELERDSGLQRVYWAILAGFFISFIFWVSDRSITLEAVQNGTHVCLPFFQQCESWFFLQDGGLLSPTFFYAFLTLTLVASSLFALKANWLWAHALLWPSTLWKIVYLGFLANNAGTDYEYFHLPVLLIFLLARNKIYFARLTFVVVYTLSATMKFDSSWMTGSYFSSLEFGLPLFPALLIPIVTHGVALFEIFSPWVLLSKNSKWKTAVFFAWIAFHIYSVQLVDFRYPLHCLAMIIALFYETTDTPAFQRSKRNFAGYAVLATLYILTFVPAFIPGDALYNLKSMKFGVRMFDANHQCTSTLAVTEGDGRAYEIKYANKSSVKRCAPYPLWFQAQRLCQSHAATTVGWVFHSSVNGGPFYKLVDSADICRTEYAIVDKNPWFVEPADGAPIVGYPRRNRLLEEINPSFDKVVFSEPNIVPSKTEAFLGENLREIKIFYWGLWALVSIFMLRRHLKFGKFR